MTNPDFRALCAELVDAIGSLVGGVKCGHYQQQDMWKCREIFDRAYAAMAQPEPARQPTFAELLMPPPSTALAQPEPVAPNPYRVRNSTRDLGNWPSREEILALGAELDERYDVDHGDVDLARAVLARWGTPAIQPVPVAPTDEELYELWEESGFESDRFARAVLAKWGTPASAELDAL